MNVTQQEQIEIIEEFLRDNEPLEQSGSITAHRECSSARQQLTDVKAGKYDPQHRSSA